MAGSARTSENEFKFSKGLVLETYVGDITQAKADVLVVPEGVSFRGLGYIGRQMMELSPKFRKNREKLKAEKPLAAWDVYTSTIGGKRFKHVIHAIVVPCPNHDVEEWSNKMHLLYLRIFQEADRKIATVLAISLLGTGRGGGRLEDTIEAAVNSVANFKVTNLKRVLFVSNEEEIVCQIASRCEWELALGGNGQKWRPLASGSDVTYNHVKVKSPVQDESAKINRKGSRPDSARERLGPKNYMSCKQAPLHRPTSGSNKSSYGKETETFHGPTKQAIDKGLNKDRKQEQRFGKKPRTRKEKTDHQEREYDYQNSYSPYNDEQSLDDKALHEFISKRNKKPSYLHQSHCDNAHWESDNAHWEMESQHQLQLQHQQQAQKRKELQRFNDNPRLLENENTVDISNRMLEHTSNERIQQIKQPIKRHVLDRLNANTVSSRDERHGHLFPDDSDENNFEGYSDELESLTNKNMTSPYVTHERPKGYSQNDLDQLSLRELSEGQRFSAEEPEIYENNRPGLNNHGERPKENKNGIKFIPEVTEYEPEDYKQSHQISEREQSRANVVESNSRSALQEKGHNYEPGRPSQPTVTQEDKERHEYGKPGQDDHGARPKEKRKDQTVDTKNNKDNSGKDICPICICEITDPKRLDKCGHMFCYDCINNSFKQFEPVCPSCNMVYGEIRGNQPDGQMNVGFSGEHLPGYEGHGTITITYYFPSGTQGVDHSNPGQPYEGTTFRAYLPDCREGEVVLKLLRAAFDKKLTFTIRRSSITGQDDVSLNDIHHKTNKDGGPIRFGYPDASYLQRVQEELARKGVTAFNELKRDENDMEGPMRSATPGDVSNKDKQPIRRFEQRLIVPAQTQEKENKKEFADALKKLGEVAREKGFTVKETDSGQDLLTALSDQLSYVLKEKIEPGHLRTVKARYLRTQSGKENNLGSFLIGTSLEAVITLIEKGGNVDCQIFLNAASHTFGVEILLIFESGVDIWFQPFSDKEFLPSLALGTVSNTRYFSLEHGPAVPDLPLTWSRSSKETELVTVQADSQEFKEVEQSFRSSIGKSKNHSVIQIKRVQSITLWRCFKANRDQIAERYPHITTESLL